MSNPLKKLPIETGVFEANGKTYFIEGNFSIERYMLYQQLQIEGGYGVTFIQMFEAFQKIEAAANQLRFTDIAVLCYNMQRGIQQVSDREHTLLKMCTLFINTKDEDRAVITDDVITEKINDWKKSEYDIAGFFTLALNTINGFIESYKSITQAITQLEMIPK